MDMMQNGFAGGARVRAGAGIVLGVVLVPGRFAGFADERSGPAAPRCG